MTLGQIFIHFLKENGLFYTYFRSSSSRLNIKQLLDSNNYFISRYLSGMFGITNLKLLFYKLFTLDPLFYYPSRDERRKAFYKLNAKWKALIDKIKIEHDIKDGDRIRILQPFFSNDTFLVKSCGNKDGYICLINEQSGKTLNSTVFEIKMLNKGSLKDPVINISFK